MPDYTVAADLLQCTTQQERSEYLSLEAAAVTQLEVGQALLHNTQGNEALRDRLNQLLDQVQLSFHAGDDTRWLVCNHAFSLST